MVKYANILHSIFKAAGITCAVATLSACSTEPAYSEGLEALKLEFKAANAANSIDPLLALYHLEGSDDYTLTLLRGTLQSELGMPIREISFEPLSGAPEELISYSHNGVDYGPSLEPAHRMRVIYGVEDGFTSLFTIGQNEGGVWKIVSARPAASPPKPR
jgi:hypothetical protein